VPPRTRPEPGEANTLYYLEDEPRWRNGVLVASEPLDDGPGWHEVGPDTLVRVDGRRELVDELIRTG